jgi:hypothetical protein
MRQLAFLATVLLVVGCGAERPVAQTATSNLLEGFENDPLWSQDSAGAHAEMACRADEAVQGSTALVVQVRAGTQDKAIIRKEVELDASALTRLRVAVRTVTGPPPQIAFALRGAGGAWIESPFVALQPGWNRDLAWDPRSDPGWAKAAPAIERINLLVKPQGGDCVVAFDDLRGEGAWRWRGEPARLLHVSAPPAEAGLHQPLELTCDIAWPDPLRAAAAPAKGNPERMLQRMVAGGAWITAPDGERWFQPAACIGSVVRDGQAVQRQAVRLSPDRAGSWSLRPGVADGRGGWLAGPEASVVVAPTAANRGAVRISRTDRRWLERADGSFIWPLGMNVAWAGDYTPWLDRLQADGCTALRVWLCPWGNPLDVAGDLQTVNQVSAAAIDQLLDGALERGLVVQVCLTYHGWFDTDWARNPFNSANGGPIADGREFWTDWKAKAGFRRVLDYASARWGHHPALLAWELVNEVDLAPRHRDEDLIDWHREMAGHLARVDRRRHPITTSVAVPGRLAGLWRLGDLDVVNVHRYERDPLIAIAGVASDVAATGKPGWAAEAGCDWLPRGEQADPAGVYLRQALWWSWTHGLAASSWAWWWDTQVQNHGLTRHHAALARFLAGEDPRGQQVRPLVTRSADLAVAALAGADRAWIYAADPAATRPGAPASVTVARPLTLSGLAPGAWTAERWDTLLGQRVTEEAVTVGEDGTIALTLPAGNAEAAWKLRRRVPLQPELRLP